VIRASLYIVTRSAWNRVRLRLRRLREPRYLLGAAASAAYLYFSIFQFRQPGPRSARRRGGGAVPALLSGLDGGSLVALLLACGAAVTWALPFRGALLDFSRSEIQFLFPAPVTRRQLLLHRIVRAQFGLLFAAIVPAVLFPRGSGASRLRFAVAMWILLSAIRLFVTGVSLSRPWLRRGTGVTRALAWAPLILTGAAALVVGSVVGSAFLSTPAPPVSAVLAALPGLVGHGMPRLVLAPFRALGAPLFAPDWWGYAAVLPGSLLMLGLVGAWVLSSDEAFEAASDAAVDGRQPLQSASARYAVRGGSHRLASVGAPEWALVWKAATETRRLVTTRALVRFTLPLVAVVVIATAADAFPRGLAELFSVLALVSLGFGALMGPQILRTDLRQELEHLALLKTWPLASGAVLRGLLIWPVSIVTVSVWGLVLAAALLVPFAFPGLPTSWRVFGTVAVLAGVPGLIAGQYVIHNAAALLFPAWVASGDQRPRGFDAMGQRLILLAGTWLSLAVLMIPAVMAAAILWRLLAPPLGVAILVPAAFAFTIVLLLEAVLATEALGRLYDRLDVTDIERAE
jgi:ABC-2 type transport system permease protein